MTLDNRLWTMVRCVACGREPEHVLELLLPMLPGHLTPMLVGFCERHYQQARRLPQWNELPIVEAAALEPKGVG